MNTEVLKDRELTDAELDLVTGGYDATAVSLRAACITLLYTNPISGAAYEVGSLIARLV
jgi:hypothetical protein